MLKCNLFLWCNAVFSALLLQSSVSHDPSEIIIICWFAAQETFLIIIFFENSCSATYFLWKLWHILFFRILRWIEIFCNINVFTVHFDQFNAPLLKKSTIIICTYWPQTMYIGIASPLKSIGISINLTFSRYLKRLLWIWDFNIKWKKHASKPLN